MNIKQVLIEGEAGDLEIRRTETGAMVTANGVEIEVQRTADREERFSVAWNAAKVVYGTTRRPRRRGLPYWDEPNCTNSMIHDVMREIDRVAGC